MNASFYVGNKEYFLTKYSTFRLQSRRISIKEIKNTIKYGDK